MDATSFKQSLDDLMVTFYNRMDSFEGKLQKTPATSSKESLAAEFTTFKSFVTMSLRTLQAQIEWLSKETDQLEMRGRRKILLLHGLAEDPKEDTAAVVAKTVVKQLKQTTFLVGDIGRRHRMGRAGSSDKPRPILCKFRDVSVRDKIWSSKASLKGTGITISEFLTRSRHCVFMEARQRFGISNCWTREGNVFVLGPDGARHRISCQKDLSKITSEAQNIAPAAKEAVAPTKSKRTATKK